MYYAYPGPGISPFLDAVALIQAKRDHDWDTVQHLLAVVDCREMASVLAQMVITAAGGGNIADFLAMQVEATLDGLASDFAEDIDEMFN